VAVCYVALGGNLGPVRETLDRAVAALRSMPEFEVGRISSFFRTPAVGEHAGGDFLNAACEIVTELDPLTLLNSLQILETRLGRTRERHWGPRTLDLDLLLYGSDVISTPRLTVPHPACWYRRFVLDPLAEIAADVVHPVKRISIGQLRERLLRRPLPVALAGGSESERLAIAAWLGLEFPAVQFSDWTAGDQPHSGHSQRLGEPASGGELPTFIVWLGNGNGHGNDAGFLALPELPRIDATHARDPVEEFLRQVLQSALG
jgi:2-amino-4-hydroxy-6-hydroxymethyldihydropteridine diphosphokinase